MCCLIVFVSVLFLSCNRSTVDTSQMVNPILGDISFENKFGFKPDATTDNELRIRTHLEYVEHLLRNKDVGDLTAELQTNRNLMLDLLHQYWTNGVFPKNYDYAEQRKPCFIDKDGTICAVGYLVEQTTSRQVAENINSKFKYDEVLAMNDAVLEKWVSNSGLTKEECAMIQPTYGPVPTYSYNYISPNYGIASSIIGGLNLAFITVNGIQIGTGTTSQTAPVFGIITGAGQLTLGAVVFYNETNNNWGQMYSNESQKALSMVNMGLGTTTMILSTWNLIANHQPKDKLTTWNIYNFPTQDNYTGMAFSLTRRF